MMQAFEWHVPDDQAHWNRLHKALPSLKDIGVDNIWIPPGCKGMSPSGNGYDIYDLYDLGEFEQKGSRGTKWGTKAELQELIWLAQDLGIGVYWDAVLNHKAAADYTERFSAVRVDPQRELVGIRMKGNSLANVITERNNDISQPEEIEGWVGYNFPGRGDKYSSMKYHWYHFSGVDWDDSRKKSAIYKIVGPDKGWAPDVSDENGNYDFLMFADVDYSNAEVREDVLRWGEWIGTELPLNGMRLDAVKHYSADFQREFIDHVRNTVGPEYFIIGEYWKGEVRVLLEYLEKMKSRLSLFDAPLVGRFSSISRTKEGDLRRIFDGTLVQAKPEHAVVGLLYTPLFYLDRKLILMAASCRHLSQTMIQ